MAEDKRPATTAPHSQAPEPGRIVTWVATGPIGPQGAYVAERGKSQTPENQDAERKGSLSMQSWKIAEPEMRVILTALLNPPKPVEWQTASYAVLSAAFFALKTLIDSKGALTGLNIIAVVFSVIIAALAIARVASQARAKHPFHEIAIEHARKLETAQKNVGSSA